MTTKRWPRGSYAWWLQKKIGVLGGLGDARKATGRTRRDLAARFGVSAETLRRWERDEQDPRRGSALLRAARFVGR